MQAQMQLRQEEQVAMFKNSLDLLVFKAYKRIMAKDHYQVWYISDFLDLGSRQTVRKALIELERKGFLVKVKAYPVFWKRMR